MSCLWNLQNIVWSRLNNFGQVGHRKQHLLFRDKLPTLKTTFISYVYTKLYTNNSSANKEQKTNSWLPGFVDVESLSTHGKFFAAAMFLVSSIFLRNALTWLGCLEHSMVSCPLWTSARHCRHMHSAQTLQKKSMGFVSCVLHTSV